jgi:hypothetical protein
LHDVARASYAATAGALEHVGEINKTTESFLDRRARTMSSMSGPHDSATWYQNADRTFVLAP